MELKEFSEINRKRCTSSQGFNHQLGDWGLSDWMVALTGEVGEAANIVKKLNRYRDGLNKGDVSEEQLRIDLIKELADVFIYIDLFFQVLGVDISKAVIQKFNETSTKIGYPYQIPSVI